MPLSEEGVIEGGVRPDLWPERKGAPHSHRGRRPLNNCLHLAPAGMQVPGGTMGPLMGQAQQRRPVQ